MTSSPDRRRFLVGGISAIGLGALTAACSSGNNDSSSSTTRGPSRAADLAVAEKAAGLEVLAVAAYATLTQKAGSAGPAPVEYLRTARAHHQQHLDAWNKVLSDNDREAITQPDAGLKPTIDAKLANVKNGEAALELALELEQIASATYLKVLPALKEKRHIELVTAIHVVDMQHQAFLHIAMGDDPVPATFASTKEAAT